MAKKVLIVDSDPGLTVSLEFIMKKEDHDVLIVSTGKEAYNTVLANEPDLIILDVVLPDCTGFEVCQRIREHSSLATKIILLTSKGRNKDIEKGKALGADLYIVKPFSTIEFIDDVRSILGGG
jgi:DNA-binding response OmpR family regulator